MWADKQKAVEAKQEAVQALCARELAAFKELDSQWYQNDQQYKVLPNSLPLPPSLCPLSLLACTVHGEAACMVHVGACVGRSSEGG